MNSQLKELMEQLERSIKNEEYWIERYKNKKKYRLAGCHHVHVVAINMDHARLILKSLKDLGNNQNKEV